MKENISFPVPRRLMTGIIQIAGHQKSFILINCCRVPILYNAVYGKAHTSLLL